MTDDDLKRIIYFALGFLLPQIILWLAFGAYLLLTGRA